MEKERKLVVSFPYVSEEHRKKIAEIAGRYGCRAVFCDDTNEGLKEAADAEIVLAFSNAFAKAGENIKWICTPTAGANHYLNVLSGDDVMLTNSAGAFGLTIAEHIVMVTLEILRRRPEYIKLGLERKWEQHLPVKSIAGSRVTFVGTGDIGQEAAERIRAFKPASVIGVNRGGKNPGDLFDKIYTIDKLDEVLPETDILILSLPSTKETAGLFDKERLARLPETSYLINVGRGDVLDEKELEKMLREGRLGGAALDVFEKEPLDSNSTLWDCPRLILTTHVAGNWTLPHTVNRIVEMFEEDLENYFEGRPLKHRVDPVKGY